MLVYYPLGRPKIRSSSKIAFFMYFDAFLHFFDFFREVQCMGRRVWGVGSGAWGVGHGAWAQGVDKNHQTSDRILSCIFFSAMGTLKKPCNSHSPLYVGNLRS